MASNNKKILLLPGDGIGPEIMVQVVKILSYLKDKVGLTIEEGLLGGIAIDNSGSPYPEKTQKQAEAADAVLLAAVGGAKWDALPIDQRPERGLLGIRKGLGLYANIRPLDMWEPLMGFSPLRPERLRDVSFVVVRELTGDLYFGTPRGIDNSAPGGKRRGFNTMVYDEDEIRRIAHVAFKLARQRKKKVCSVDKANVLETMRLWREVVTEVGKEYSDVSLDHMYVDNAAMQIITKPAYFDVILTGNMFGDIISDEAAVLSGSLGLLPSASVGDKHALYEPIHGSAPDIAGKNIANPMGMILSAAMMFDISFGRTDIGDSIRKSVKSVLDKGYRTRDIWQEGKKQVSTDEMGSLILEGVKSK
jgi:3-isopropylmalate dehydrogenase